MGGFGGWIVMIPSSVILYNTCDRNIHYVSTMAKKNPVALVYANDLTFCTGIHCRSSFSDSLVPLNSPTRSNKTDACKHHGACVHVQEHVTVGVSRVSVEDEVNVFHDHQFAQCESRWYTTTYADLPRVHRSIGRCLNCLVCRKCPLSMICIRKP